MMPRFKFPTLDSLAAVAAPYMQYSTELTRRQAAIGKDVESLFNSTVHNMLGVATPDELRETTANTLEKSQELVLNLAKAEFAATMELSRVVLAKLMGAEILPRSMLLGHQIEKVLHTQEEVASTAFNAAERVARQAIAPVRALSSLGKAHA